ncbi:MAG: ESX-1 secretion-associated protein [Mycobacteriaceae bacterium]|nr:ESX-1 secretion-associated protein [Mycobacteriaceae bacterium]
MANVTVDPDYLEKLAKLQDEAAEGSAQAGELTDGISRTVWTTHGVVSHVSNHEITAAENSRATAAQNISDASARLAATLRPTAQTYAGVDTGLGWNLDRQVRDR